MNAQQMINSGLLESFVLGITSPEETAQVQTALNKFPELTKEIENIEKTLFGLGDKTPAPGAHVRDNILAQINTTSQDDKPVRRVGSEKNRYVIALAACVALFVVSVVCNLVLLNRTNSLQNQMTRLEGEKEILSDTLKGQRDALDKLAFQMKVVTDPSVKPIVLKGMNNCELQTTSVFWNKGTGEVYFKANVPQPGENYDYQLWAIVDGKPVDAGVIHFENGVTFESMKSIKGASAFAVTLEKKGGSVVPTLSAMCFLGEVGA